MIRLLYTFPFSVRETISGDLPSAIDCKIMLSVQYVIHFFAYDFLGWLGLPEQNLRFNGMISSLLSTCVSQADVHIYKTWMTWMALFITIIVPDNSPTSVVASMWPTEPPPSLVRISLFRLCSCSWQVSCEPSLIVVRLGLMIWDL
jgi:hypothetical protein